MLSKKFLWVCVIISLFFVAGLAYAESRDKQINIVTSSNSDVSKINANSNDKINVVSGSQKSSDSINESDLEKSFGNVVSNLSIEEKQRLMNQLREMARNRGMEVSELAKKLSNASEQERREIIMQIRNLTRTRERLTLKEALMNNGSAGEIKLKNNIKVRLQSGDIIFESEKGKKIITRLNLSEDDEGNLVVIKSNGKNATIKIMPDTASERAIERLKLKVCNESNNCTIELKDVGQRVVYELKAKKTYRFLWIIKRTKDVSASIDAETGEVI